MTLQAILSARARISDVLLLFLILTAPLGAQTVSLDRFPARLQLYPRGMDDSAAVPVSGRLLTAGYDSAIVEVWKNTTLQRRIAASLQYAAGEAAFSFAPAIHAERAEYRIVLAAKAGASTTVLASRDSIVCGDVYLITGQSNSVPADAGATYVSEYCRSFGRPTGYGGYDTADTLWSLARGNGADNYLGHVSVWGLRLLRLISETYGIPVAALNGGTGGSTIEWNLPNPANHFDLGTSYGRLLYRAEKAGIRNSVRAILWHQGESNSDASWAQYTDNFRLLYNAWHADYPGYRRTYVFQVHPGCGGDNADRLREAQRRFPAIFDELEIMSTAALPGHDGCHYVLEGYHEMALTVFRQIARDFHGSTDVVDIDPPNILKAWYATPAHTEVRLLFSGTSTLEWPADTLGHAMREGFFLDGAVGLVASGKANRDTVTLALTLPSDARTVRYIPSVYYPSTSAIYEGPWLKNARRVGALTFSEFPIQFPPAGAPVLIAPEPWAADQPATLQLRWNAVAYASQYRIQISTDSLFLAPPLVDEQLRDTAIARGSFAGGARLAWRVRAVNDAVEGAWSPYRCFTIVPPPPEAPLLATPADGAKDQPMSVRLHWHPVAGALRYEAAVSRDAGFASTLIRLTDLTDTTCAIVHGLNDTRLYWRVRASDARAASAWSEVWSFETAPETPGAVLLAAPMQGDSLVPQSGTLVWHPAARATSYRVQLCADSLFAGVLTIDAIAQDTALPYSGLASWARYFWRARAANSGGEGPWSAIARFSTAGAPPAAPQLLAPGNAANDVPVAVMLRWRRSDEATGYRVQLAEDSAFSIALREFGSLTDSVCTVAALARNTRYYWRARAEGRPQGSGWSAVWSFRTVPQAPLAVVLIAPADDARDRELPVDLLWQRSAGAMSYRIEAARDAVFQQLLDSAVSWTDSTWQLANSPHAARVYWRVQARNAGGEAPWSEVRSFVTVLPLPAAPLLRMPLDSMTVPPRTGLFSWTPVQYADAYRLEVINVDGQGYAAIDTTIAGTQIAPDGLRDSALYTWKVRAVNARGAGPWSLVRTFSTLGLPETPLPLEPAPNAKDARLPVRCVWTLSRGAAWYDLQYGTDGSFQSGVTERSQLPLNNAQLDGLLAQTRYYWRVRAGNAAGVSAWSTVAAFITAPAVPAVPQLRSPQHGARLASAPLLQWSAVAGAAFYRMQLSLDSSFATWLVNDSLASAASNTSASAPLQTPLWWRVRAGNAGGESPWSDTWQFVIDPASAREAVPTAEEFRIEAVYPNPLRASGGEGAAAMLTVRYALTAPADVTVDVIDVFGRIVARAAAAVPSPGMHEMRCDLRGVAAGFHLVQLRSGGRRLTAGCVVAGR